MPKIRNYQIEAAVKMAAMGKFLLADAPRVGKTAAAIHACDLVNAKTVLWVTTGSARVDHARAWGIYGKPRQANVIMKGTDRLFDGLNIISYDLAVKFAPRLMEIDWDVVVLDEVHKLKGRDTHRTQALLGNLSHRKWGPGVVHKAKHVFALSGTPAPNNYAELWPFLRSVLPETIMRPDGRGPYPYWDFAQRYTVMVDKGFGLKIERSRNGPELKARIAKHTMRRTLADIAPEVPKLTADVLELSDMAAVNALKKLELDPILEQLGTLLDKATRPEEREQIIRMAQARVDKKVLRLTALAKVPAVCDWLQDEMHDKLVVFAWHHEVLDLLEAWCQKVKCGYVRIDGTTPGDKRAKLVDSFQGDRKCHLFLGQIKAAGEGIDLSAADEILFVESSWTPGDNEQASMRVVNVNKTVPTLARFATIKGSVDERVQKVAARKLGDIKGLFK